MLATLIDVQVAQQRFDSIVLAWKPVGSSQAIAATSVDVQRSYAQNDGFASIGGVPAAATIYVGEASNKQQKWLNVYYRLVADDGTTTKTYGPLSLSDGEDTFVDRTINRRINLYFKNNGSVPCLIYQQAYGPEVTRCPKCWDKELQQVIYFNCDLCLGTSYIGPLKGYYHPVLTLVDISPSPSTNVLEDTVQANNTTKARMGGFPILRPNDLIREINTGVIWTVSAVDRQIKSRSVLSQDPVALRNIRPADIEYDLPIPTTLVPIMRRHRPKKERILLDNPDSSPTFIEVVI